MISVGEGGRDGWMRQFPYEICMHEITLPPQNSLCLVNRVMSSVLFQSVNMVLYTNHTCVHCLFHNLPHFRPLSLPNEINWPVMEICYHFLPTIYAYQNIYMFSSHSRAFIYADDWPNLTSSTWSSCHVLVSHTLQYKSRDMQAKKGWLVES